MALRNRNRGKSGSGSLLVTAVALLLTATAISITIVTLVAGYEAGMLDEFALFEVDVSDFNLASRLARSSRLSDISSVSGGDLTGTRITRESLGLSDVYTVHLLTQCSHSSVGTVCTSPEIGAWLNPWKTLRLGALNLPADAENAINEAFDAYEDAAYFMGIGIIVSLALTILAPLFSGFGSRLRWAGVIGAVLSWLATILLLADGILIIITCANAVDALNDSLQQFSLDTTLGGLRFLPMAAFAVSFISSILYTVKARNRGTKISPRRGMASKLNLVESSTRNKAQGSQPGLLQRAMTWRSQRYARVEEQTAEAQEQPKAETIWESTSPDYAEGVVSPPPLTLSRAPDSDSKEELDYRNPAEERDIAMMSLPGQRSSRLDLAYEPYSSMYTSQMSREGSRSGLSDDEAENPLFDYESRRLA